jgi:hypothetical protein
MDTLRVSTPTLAEGFGNRTWVLCSRYCCWLPCCRRDTPGGVVLHAGQRQPTVGGEMDGLPAALGGIADGALKAEEHGEETHRMWDNVPNLEFLREASGPPFHKLG